MKIQLSFAAEIFRASALGRERAIETYENLYYGGKPDISNQEGVGDGGFLYSSMELETAVRLKQDITVLVFRDGGYNMVGFQQELIYGRTSGTDFGNPDIVKYAESFGGVGLRVNKPDELLPTLRKALETPGVVVVDIPTDYSGNIEIGQHVLPEAWD